ncbi:hypothetical protein B0H12DRAFT_1145527 [Mycena haematopus]|nr:hypothetical protein B0H12DRAFT_1145527 [Mycena haematopus]
MDGRKGWVTCLLPTYVARTDSQTQLNMHAYMRRTLRYLRLGGLFAMGMGIGNISVCVPTDAERMSSSYAVSWVGG